MVNHPNRSRVARILAQYADLGALDDDSISQRVIGSLRWMQRHGHRMPRGAGPVADDLLAALRAWNACYDGNGYLRSGAPEADRRSGDVARYEARLLPLIDDLPHPDA